MIDKNDMEEMINNTKSRMFTDEDMENMSQLVNANIGFKDIKSYADKYFPDKTLSQLRNLYSRIRYGQKK